MTNATFDSNDIQTANILLQNVDHFGMATKDAPIYPLAHANKSSMPFINYPNRTIVLEGQLIHDSVAELDALCDTFKGYFVNENANFDIDHNSGTRRYIATAVDVDVSRPRGMTYATFKVTLLCTEPFGRNISATTLLTANNRTNASYSDEITVGGNAKYQLPVITITIDSVTDGDAHITVSNDATSQGISVIGQTFAASDVLVIDCVNRVVTLNDVEIDFAGSFPEFETGTQDINYEDGFSARQFDITVTQYPYWL